MQDNNGQMLGQDGGQPLGHLQVSLIRLGLAVAVCFFLASHTLPALFPPTFHGFLLIAASITSLIAALRLEHPFAPVLTRWDEALVLILIAFVSLKFADPEAVKQAVETLQAKAAAGTSAR